ncbi:hypothetical protein D9M68_832550 [compost metagenome]
MLPPISNWVTLRLSPSISLSLLSTVPDTGVSSVTAMGPSLFATGASFSWLTLPKLSSAVSVRLPSLRV